jgi:hypothetical protein
MVGLDLYGIMVNDFSTRNEQQAHTKAFLQEHALEEDLLGILALVTNADLVIQWSEAGFDKVHSTHAIWAEPNACAAESSDRLVQTRSRKLTPLQSILYLPRTR